MKKSFIISIGCMLVMSMALTSRHERRVQIQPKEDSPPHSLPGMKTKMDFGKMPLYFIPNEGQLDEQVAFYVQGKDKTLYFTPGGVTFALTSLREDKANRSLRELETMDTGNPSPDDPKFMEQGFKRGKVEERKNAERWVVKLDFVGANPEVKPQGLDQTGGVVSYFKGKSDDWHTGLATYSKVVYRNLWPGIDLIYCGTVNKLKYEFVVHPGADPSRIRLAYRGADKVEVDDAGRLDITTPTGKIQDDKPIAYQKVGGKSIDIALSYKLRKFAASEPTREESIKLMLNRGPRNDLREKATECASSGTFGFLT